MKKVVIIDKCESCPFCVFDDGEVEERWGTYWCRKLDVAVAYNDIPEDCPLETVYD